MNATMIILIGIFLIMIGILGYLFYDVFKRWLPQIRHIISCRKHKKNKDALVIDYWKMDPAFNLDDHRMYMDRRMRWEPIGAYIEEPYEDLFRQGYMRAEKWMSELRYVGIPVFVKLHNFKLIDPRTQWKELGLPRPNLITTSVLCNVYRARTVKKYISNMLGKVKFAEMDVKVLAFIIPIVLGVAVGVFYLFFGGF